MRNYPWLLQNFGPRLLDPASPAWVDRLPGSLGGQRVDEEIPHFLSIRDRGGSLQDFGLNRAQRVYANQRTARNIILKARQVGMTTYIAARFFLLTLFRPGTVTLQVAHTLEAAQRIFRIVQRFYENLQKDLREQVIIERANVRELAFALTDSRYLVDTAGNRNVGRGLTIHNLHASEVALWPGDAAETMAGLLAAVVPGGHVDVESTPNGVGGYFHSEWLRAQKGEPGAMTPHFFPWWLEPAYRRDTFGQPSQSYSPDEQRLMEREGLQPEQIQFRRWIRATFADRAPQEYAETDVDCFLLSGRPVFEVADIEARLREVPRPVETQHNGGLLIWLPPTPGRSYILAADVAEGRSRGDDSAAVIVDAATGLQCAELLVRWPVWRFAQELDRLARRYNTALLAVERNNHGHAVLHALRHQLHYPRLYRHPDAHGPGPAADGWPTTAQTKPAAVQALAEMLRDAPAAFASARLLEQCRRFSWTDNGGMAAPPGRASRAAHSSSDTSGEGHDDLVIAMAIALAVRKQSPPLALLASPL